MPLFFKNMDQKVLSVLLDKLRGKTVGETIVEADILRKKDGSAPTADEIFNYSKNGEVSMLFQWYPIAVYKLYVNLRM